MHKVKKKLRVFGTIVVAFFIAAALVCSSVFIKSVTASASTAHLSSAHMQDGFLSHTVKIKPITKKIGEARSVRLKTALASGANKVLFPCQSDTNPQPMFCYGPGQIAQAYNVQNLWQRDITGAGSTIVIVDAYGSPTIQADLHAFDADWGLSDPPLFNVLTPNGGNNADYSWAGETSLDVEWAHAMAPGAAITLVVAPSNSDVDLYNAIKYAVDQNLGDVISLSFGENESCIDPNLMAAEHQVFQQAADKGISVVASSGDVGSAQFTCDGFSLTTAVSFPASDPLITALGGSELTANATTGQYIGETAWNESGAFNTASGGGYSVLNQRPAYQAGVTGTVPGRAVPDLALNASVNGGVLVYQSDSFSGQEYVSIVGGTSVAAPEFAGLIADGVQMAHHRLGFLNESLYSLKGSSLAFHDIVSGNNILLFSGVTGSTVQSGWDAVTGWGTPRADMLLPLLIDHERSGNA